ncbi:hypothetical protein [Staphylococcus aureus]
MPTTFGGEPDKKVYYKNH